MIAEVMKKGFDVVLSSFPLLAVWFAFQLGLGVFPLLIYPAIVSYLATLHLALALFVYASFYGPLVLFYVYLRAATLVYVRDNIKSGETRASCFTYGFNYCFRLVLFYFVFLMIFIGIVLGIYLILTLFKIQESGIDFTIYLAAFIMVCMATFMLYAPTIIVADDAKTTPAMKRSVNVVRNHKKITLILFGFYALVWVLMGGFNMLTAEYSKWIILPLAAILSSLFEIYITAVVMNVYLRLSQNE